MKFNFKIPFIVSMLTVSACEKKHDADSVKNGVAFYTVIEARDGDTWLYNIYRNITSELWMDGFTDYKSHATPISGDGHAGDGYSIRIVVTSAEDGALMLSFANSNNIIVEERLEVHKGTISHPQSFKSKLSELSFKRHDALGTLAKKTLDP